MTRILQNIEPQGTDATTLVLLVRLLSPDEASRSAVLRFVQQYYPKDQSDGLHDEKEFETIWRRKTPKGYFAPALEEYLDLAIEAHDFIHSSLRDIMGRPVKSYTIDGGDITFQLDFTHYSTTIYSLEPVHYQLDCMTRVITSSEGRGVLHRLLGEGHVLGYFQKNGGIQCMADLAEAENLSRYMRYDGAGETWRVFDTKSGIWREQTTPDEPIKKLSQFLKRLLVPIQEHAEYLGAKEFDWLRGKYVSSDIGADSMMIWRTRML